MRVADLRTPEFRRRRAESTLYILRFRSGLDDLEDPFGLKIGRTNDLAGRTGELERSMPYRVEILGVFPGAGCLEAAVHRQLAHCRNTNGAGREWFNVSLADAVCEISILMGNINAADASSGKRQL